MSVKKGLLNNHVLSLNINMRHLYNTPNITLPVGPPRDYVTFKLLCHLIIDNIMSAEKTSMRQFYIQIRYHCNLGRWSTPSALSLCTREQWANLDPLWWIWRFFCVDNWKLFITVANLNKRRSSSNRIFF